MEVIVAGYNVDAEVIRKCTKGATPETISAAYARISRSKDSVEKLRAEAILDVEKAKDSNTSIVFEMGHSSIAEHVIFNFDLIGISRYLAEFIHRSRLASFTEKSQRYVTLDGDFYLPEEVRNSKLREDFEQVISEQNSLYELLFAKAKEKLEADGFAGSKRDRFSKAKEDARYFLSLSTLTQMGITINARSLQKLLVRLDKSDLHEAKKLKKKLEEEAKKIAPSLIRYTDADDFTRFTWELPENKEIRPSEKVKLINASDNPDDLVLQGMLVDFGYPYEQVSDYLSKITSQEKEQIFDALFAKGKLYSSMPRGFELADFLFEVCCSACCFGQMKRHRMSTILKSEYHPDYGFVVPELIKALGEEEKIDEVIKRTNDLYFELEKEKKGLGNYILTNAHNTLILFKGNLREIYHFSRLRADEHAQWEIREIANKIDEIVREVAPLAGKFLGGKSEIFS